MIYSWFSSDDHLVNDMLADSEEDVNHSDIFMRPDFKDDTFCAAMTLQEQFNRCFSVGICMM